MSPDSYVDPALPPSDLIVLSRLLQDVEERRDEKVALKEKPVNERKDSGYESGESRERSKERQCTLVLSDGLTVDPGEDTCCHSRRQAPSTEPQVLKHESDAAALDELQGLTTLSDRRFLPTVFLTWDLPQLQWPPWLKQNILMPYVRWAQAIVRNPTDVVMVTHLLMYASTSIPSAMILYLRFSYTHAVLHWLMQSWYAGSYTLMMHQHIHMGGILKRQYAWLDRLFPYITDPLHGHTWNSYYYHHVKHHHVEGNGPSDLSSTIRYQRDSVPDFLCYVLRFMLLIWLELPTYFIRKRQYRNAAKAGTGELGSYLFLTFMATQVNFRATLFVFLLPFALLRTGLMIGNWGQHALVDEIAPDSDFRSSVTLIDVPSNRYSFNDGYHTSHHLNPHRHWREHPAAFLRQKERYAEEQALVFRNIDFLMLTFRLLRKDYDYVARCLVPMGAQIDMTRGEIAAMLRKKTRRMEEAEIREKFKQ
ncbi:MAG: hypothetical protein Q9159_002082 [Coniocarpon cinnabarinum]